METNDLVLLRRYEPALRFTRGESFFPMSVEGYLAECSLWVNYPNGTAECLAKEGELGVQRLTEARAHGFGSIYYLQFIEKVNLRTLAVYQLRDTFRKKSQEEVFHAGSGRLARVGFIPRFIDALFSLSLLARGRVPGDYALAARATVEKMSPDQLLRTYYGRVVRQAGWVTLQYWFFYPFNNWRSGFYGVNDHEADWEMVSLYLAENAAGELAPEWVAYASHDYSGDELRRRWDDPEVQKEGDHPLIFVGAGSHASYFLPGEYLAEIELMVLSPLVHLAEYVGKFLVSLRGLLMGKPEHAGQTSGVSILRVPFVDYARGDGVSIGPGQVESWHKAVLIDDHTPWVKDYRGLWGLLTKDPIAGEDAPAGPKYQRDGAPRKAWVDPLGWAGLDKVLPARRVLALNRERQLELEGELEQTSCQINEKQEQLVDLGLEAEAMLPLSHLRQLYQKRQLQIGALSGEIRKLQERATELSATLEALDFQQKRLESGELSPARAHLRRPMQPEETAQLRVNRLAEFWAAISIGIVLVAFVALVIFAREALLLGVAALVGLAVLFEALFRGRLGDLIFRLTVLLSITAMLVLFYEFFWQVVVVSVLFAGGYMLWENLREIWR